MLLKGDWAEFASTLGFRSSSHHLCPCFKCKATGGPEGSLRSVEGISAIGEPWGARDFDDWDAACRRCEVHVEVLCKPQLDILVGCLEYDKNPKGSRGRALRADIPPLRLLKGDRLEPTSAHPDTAAIDDCLVFPLRLVFWRVANQTSVRFRSPLFSRRSHILPERLCVDELHTMHLGVFQDFILAVVWQAIAVDVWGMRGGLAEEAYRTLMVNRMRASLTAWYQRQKREFRDKPVYELQDFRVTVLGTPDRPHLQAKAA